jgi:hypothetical protein
MWFLTLAEGAAGDDTRPLFATSDERVIAAVFRELERLSLPCGVADGATRRAALHPLGRGDPKPSRVPVDRPGPGE